MTQKLLSLVLSYIFIICPAFSQEIETDTLSKTKFVNKHPHDVAVINHENLQFESKPKNIILLIGDGMGVAQVFAGMSANGGELHIQNMKHIGFSKTQSSSAYVTDSGAGGTAIATGNKTYNGAIGVNPDTVPVHSILEIAEANGKATGLISTSAITHATPASFIAHQPSRYMMEEIAADFLKTDIDLFIGGGLQYFTKRTDGKNLVEELQKKNYQFVDTLSDLLNINHGKVTALLASEHLPPYSKRGEMLVPATEKAIELLSKDDDGFFLMVEGSQIDWGGHNNDLSYVTEEVLDFDRAVAIALEFAIKDKNTLVIVTADHETGGLALLNGNLSKGAVEGQFIHDYHTGEMVPVFAFGAGAEKFMGIYENTEIFDKMIRLFGF